MIQVETKQSLGRKTLFLLLVTMAFVIAIGYATARSRVLSTSSLRSNSYSEPWIRAPGESAHAGYFRKRFDLKGNVKHAWLKIAASDAFEISVNRNPLGRLYLWRPTRPFQTGTSEKGQVLLPQDPAIALNFPREYQWNGHDSWMLPTYIDLTGSLRTGKNVVVIEIESRSAPACVTFAGEIQMHDGTVIPIRSDDSWRAEPAIPGPQLVDWTEPSYRDNDWRNAVVTDGPSSWGYRSHPEELFTRAFSGSWLRHPGATAKSEVSFKTTWNVGRNKVDDAWIRLITNRKYELYVNDELVRVASTKPPDLDYGDWVLGRAAAYDPTTNPELLDPDEVGSSFVGTRFETPRKGHRILGEFRQPFSPKLTPFRYIRTYNRAQAPGVWDPKRTLAESRRTPETPDLFPERPVPNALKHDRLTGGYLGYCITNLLRPGRNRIEVRCLAKSDSNWLTQIAVDGGAIDPDGKQINFVENTEWTAEARALTDSDRFTFSQSAQQAGPVLTAGKSIPGFQYRGCALSPHQMASVLPQSIWQVGLFTSIAIGLILLAALMYGRGLAIWSSTMQPLYGTLLTATVTIVAGLLVECAWIERHEALWVMSGYFWKLVFLLAFVAAAIVGLLDIFSRSGLLGMRSQGHDFFNAVQRLPKTKFWFHLCMWVLLVGVFLRAYKCDLQPLDDDEYASAQAILAILDSGVPKFVPDSVYYTRSPFFHYVTAAIAWPFGGNLWSLRLQTVLWGAATAWLVYLCGAHLLSNHWVGFLAMLLMCLHPFEIFTGHVIRFYQMQQFFALLTVYLFCRGFVTQQSQGFRVAALFAFLLAVLSQEISVAMGPSLLFGYLFFAKDLGWSKNITLGLVSVAILSLIGLDFIVFQNLCLTRTEGVSPSVEAAVKPHFWYPLNFISIFFGYSRLHIVASFFLLTGLPLMLRECNRNTLALFVFLVSGIAMTNLLVTNVSFRYMYWLIPIWLLLSIEGMRLVLSALVVEGYSRRFHLNRHSATAAICFTICIIAVIASWSPWRIAGSYELRILGDSTGAMRWVRSQKRAGDKVAVTEPHTHCAFIESGKCDYDLALPLLYDFAVMQNGVLVDRNGGGEVVSNVDQMISEFAKGERIWILLNREKFRSRGKNMRWEYPGARFEMFVRKNCELKYRSYLWSVFLWDPARGHYLPFRLQE